MAILNQAMTQKEKKKQWLTNEDIVAMYEKHKRKPAILLWVHLTSPTTVSPETSSAGH